ncbi:MAG: hypothetical protein Q9M91_00605 [Candidatus Dojkabacteria bacterium]|nr:hypothetical protein [Candidatus Dojkabacteria bacterium]MDQ7020330.1 hypothetical protein [Candidatus Dojkabacteria bacterium]
MAIENLQIGEEYDRLSFGEEGGSLIVLTNSGVEAIGEELLGEELMNSLDIHLSQQAMIPLSRRNIDSHLAGISPRRTLSIASGTRDMNHHEIDVATKMGIDINSVCTQRTYMSKAEGDITVLSGREGYPRADGDQYKGIQLKIGNEEMYYTSHSILLAMRDHKDNLKTQGSQVIATLIEELGKENIAIDLYHLDLEMKIIISYLSQEVGVPLFVMANGPESAKLIDKGNLYPKLLREEINDISSKTAEEIMYSNNLPDKTKSEIYQRVSAAGGNPEDLALGLGFCLELDSDMTIEELNLYIRGTLRIMHKKHNVADVVLKRRLGTDGDGVEVFMWEFGDINSKVEAISKLIIDEYSKNPDFRGFVIEEAVIPDEIYIKMDNGEIEKLRYGLLSAHIRMGGVIRTVSTQFVNGRAWVGNLRLTADQLLELATMAHNLDLDKDNELIQMLVN